MKCLAILNPQKIVKGFEMSNFPPADVAELFGMSNFPPADLAELFGAEYELSSSKGIY
ncbi:hypothetical protein [Okeania sp. SIO2B3]|uniref:hypothetical protein n=1 Tax=Okeania sp. SIO2B3 TaxID=2607784 RepID=UPI0013BFA4BA|nr:hypothetical protein [Okeania sp. SIO2B3]NET45471.1 hypothetical protein [Okeania sp. SIO2B3]